MSAVWGSYSATATGSGGIFFSGSLSSWSSAYSVFKTPYLFMAAACKRVASNLSMTDSAESVLLDVTLGLPDFLALARSLPSDAFSFWSSSAVLEDHRSRIAIS